MKKKAKRQPVNRCPHCDRPGTNEFYGEHKRIVYLCDECAEIAIRAHEQNRRQKAA